MGLGPPRPWKGPSVTLPLSPTIIQPVPLSQIPPLYSSLILSRAPTIRRPPPLRRSKSGCERCPKDPNIPGANIPTLPPIIENYFLGQISIDRLITLLDFQHPTDASLQDAVKEFRTQKRRRIEVPPIPRQSPPSVPTPPPPPLPHSPLPPVPSIFAPGPINPPTTATPDPSPRSRAPKVWIHHLSPLPTPLSCNLHPPWHFHKPGLF